MEVIVSLQEYTFLLEPASDLIAEKEGVFREVMVHDNHDLGSAIARLRVEYSREQWRIINITTTLPKLPD